jgi:hypothetical protein
MDPPVGVFGLDNDRVQRVNAALRRASAKCEQSIGEAELNVMPIHRSRQFEMFVAWTICPPMIGGQLSCIPPLTASFGDARRRHCQRNRRAKGARNEIMNAV